MRIEAMWAQAVEEAIERSQSLANRLHQAKPCERPLDDPAAGQEDEAFGGVGAFDDFDGPASVSLERVAEFVSGVAAIGEYMAQLGKAETHRFQHIDRPVAVLDIGGVDGNEDQKSAGVGENVALATPDFLIRVIAPNPAALGGFDALAVDHPGRRRGLAPLDFAQVHHQHCVDRLEQGCVAKVVGKFREAFSPVGLRLAFQAARSIGGGTVSARVCQPSTLRMVICPEASSAQNSMAAVSGAVAGRRERPATRYWWPSYRAARARPCRRGSSAQCFPPPATAAARHPSRSSPCARYG
jgi:hypothetical protein